MARNLVASDDINITTSGDDISLNLTNTVKNSIKSDTINEVVKNTYTESLSASYSTVYINNTNSYSTTETFTGEYWIDDKPIYRKVFDRGSSMDSFSHNIQNVDNIWINNDKTVRIHSSGNSLPINGGTSNSNISTSCYANSTTVTINNMASVSPNQVYVCVEYTKTTD